jgi:hypothetical protein
LPQRSRSTGTLPIASIRHNVWRAIAFVVASGLFSIPVLSIRQLLRGEGLALDLRGFLVFGLTVPIVALWASANRSDVSAPGQRAAACWLVACAMSLLVVTLATTFTTLRMVDASCLWTGTSLSYGVASTGLWLGAKGLKIESVQ